MERDHIHHIADDRPFIRQAPQKHLNNRQTFFLVLICMDPALDELRRHDLAEIMSQRKQQILKYTKKRKGENENKWQHSKVKKPMDQEMET